MELDRNPRWRRLHDLPWRCSVCGEEHQGLMDFGASRPSAIPTDLRSEVPPLVPGKTRNFLDSDFCVFEGKQFFIRCRLQLRIIGSAETFEFGLWSSLSERNFKLYFESFASETQGALGPWFGWLSNSLPGYPDTFCLKCQVHPQDGRMRPLLELEPTDHPLAVQQREGITFDEILEFFAAAGHDIRPALEAG